MKRKLIAILCLAALVLTAAGCSEKEESTTTLTGMVVSVEGTVVNLWKTGSAGMGQGMGQMPEGNFTMPEGDFTVPEGGFNRPEGDFTMPEGDFTMPEGGFNRPEGDFTMPEGAEMPTRPAGGERPETGDSTQLQTTAVDLKNAHISIQDGDIKAAGSISDIKAGSFLTITLNSKGEATEVLVSSMSFGGNGFNGTGFSGGGFGGGGFGGGKGNRGDKSGQGSSQTT